MKGYSLVTTTFLPERPGIYCLRMRVIRARVVHHRMRNDVYGRRGFDYDTQINTSVFVEGFWRTRSSRGRS